MLVHFVTDEPTKVAAIRAALEPRYQVIPQLLGGGDTQITSSGVVMVDADLRERVRVGQIRRVLQQLNRIPKKLFVVQKHVRSMLPQAYALGATAVVCRPREIIPKLAQMQAGEPVEPIDFAVISSEMKASAAAIASMFSAACGG